MRERTGLSTVFLLTPPLFLLLPIAVLTFALERISYALFAVQTDYNFRRNGRQMTFYGPTTPNATRDDYRYIDVDISVNIAPTAAIIGMSIIAAAVAIFGACGIWELRKVEGTANHQRKWAWFTIILLVGFAGACFGVLGWASKVQGEEGWKGYQDVVVEGQRFTRETWVCQIERLFPKQNWGKTACGVSTATRFMLIPLAVAALGVVGAVWVLVNDRGGLKWLCGGKGRYGGFNSVYEPPKPSQIPAQKPQNEGSVPQ